MGTAENFMNAFFETYPQAKSGDLSMEELNKLIGEYQKSINNGPLEDFDGLSPEQMNTLLYSPFAPGSIIRFHANIEEHVLKSPFFKLSELLIKQIKLAGQLKLTQNGNLPVRICELLCNQNLIYWPFMKFVKRIREEEVPYLWPLKQYLLDQGIVKKRNNALSLTKNGEKLLQESSAIRFISVFNFMASRFHWGNFYRLDDGGKCGQLGWAYSLVLLSKYGNTIQKNNFYSLKLIRAFERELWDAQLSGEAGEVLENHHYAYQVRFFESFADWFGLVNITRKREPGISYIDQLSIKKSDLFDQLFELNYLEKLP